MEQEIRWEEHYSNFIRALYKFSQAVEYIKQHFLAEGKTIDEDNRVLFEMIKETLIQRFQYTHELACKVMKDYAAYQGNTAVGGSRDAVREAFQLQLVSNAKVWIDMIKSRHKTSHLYKEETAEELYSEIMEEYHPAFLEFLKNMQAKRSREQDKFI